MFVCVFMCVCVFVCVGRPGLGSRSRRGSVSRSSHTSDLEIGTPVATLPGAWRYRVSAGTGWSGVGILRLDELV